MGCEVGIVGLARAVVYDFDFCGDTLFAEYHLAVYVDEDDGQIGFAQLDLGVLGGRIVVGPLRI